MLVAEPEAIIRLTIMRELYAADLTPLCVATAEAAVNAACGGSFAVAVVECVFDGAEPGSVLKDIRACCRDTPLLCTTTPGYRETAIHAGATTVIEKPYLYPYLVQCIASHLT